MVIEGNEKRRVFIMCCVGNKTCNWHGLIGLKIQEDRFCERPRKAINFYREIFLVL